MFFSLFVCGASELIEGPRGTFTLRPIEFSPTEPIDTQPYYNQLRYLHGDYDDTPDPNSAKLRRYFSRYRFSPLSEAEMQLLAENKVRIEEEIKARTLYEITRFDAALTKAFGETEMTRNLMERIRAESDRRYIGDIVLKKANQLAHQGDDQKARILYLIGYRQFRNDDDFKSAYRGMLISIFNKIASANDPRRPTRPLFEALLKIIETNKFEPKPEERLKYEYDALFCHMHPALVAGRNKIVFWYANPMQVGDISSKIANSFVLMEPIFREISSASTYGYRYDDNDLLNILVRNGFVGYFAPKEPSAASNRQKKENLPTRTNNMPHRTPKATVDAQGWVTKGGGKRHVEDSPPCTNVNAQNVQAPQTNYWWNHNIWVHPSGWVVRIKAKGIDPETRTYRGSPEVTIGFNKYNLFEHPEFMGKTDGEIYKCIIDGIEAPSLAPAFLDPKKSPIANTWNHRADGQGIREDLLRKAHYRKLGVFGFMRTKGESTERPGLFLIEDGAP